MTKVDVVTIDGSKKGSIELKKTKPTSPVLISRVVLANLSNKRRSIAHTKTRGEVSGGGKKPWRQKGTGRARAGSNRSPLWVGGGTTFGPRKEANFYKRINKKEKQSVLVEILRKKIEEENLKVVEKISVPSGKTKDMLKVLSSLGIDDKALLVLDKETSSTSDGEGIYKSGRNIDFLKIINIDKLNAFMALKYKWLVITKAALEYLNDKALESKSSFSKIEEDKKKEPKPAKKVVEKEKITKEVDK